MNNKHCIKTYRDDGERWSPRMSSEDETISYTEEELKGIRVRYSTIINFLSRLYKLVISIGFTLFVTRKLTVQEYGLFTTIMALISIFTTPTIFTNMWIRRFYARKRYGVVAAALALSILYVPLGFILSVIAGYLFIGISGANLIVFIMGGIIVAANIIWMSVASILVSTKPFLDGKIRIYQETVRFFTAYILVVMLTYRVLGALSAVLASVIIALIMSAYYIRKYRFKIPRPRLIWEHIRRILFNSYIPLVNMISSILMVFERPLVTLITRTTVIAAYFGVSYIPRSVIMQTSGGLTIGLSAKLLRTPSRKDTEDVLRITSIISIGMTFLMLLFGISILSLFRVEYASAYLLFALYSIEAILITYANVFRTVAISSETKDLYSFGAELKSTPLFKLSLAYLIRCAATLVIGALSSYALILAGVGDPVMIALPYPLMWMLSAIPYLLYTYKSAKQKLAFIIPWREILASIISGIIASIPVYLLGGTSIIIRNFWAEAFVLIRYGVLWLGVFTVVLLGLSRWTREFVREGLKYLFRRS